MKIELDDRELLKILTKYYHLKDEYKVIIYLNQEGVSAGEPPIVKKAELIFDSDSCIPMSINTKWESEI